MNPASAAAEGEDFMEPLNTDASFSLCAESVLTLSMTGARVIPLFAEGCFAGHIIGFLNCPGVG
jgi:hypothetical protein